MDISIVIPLLNEEDSLPELNVWLKKVLNEMGCSYEIIYVDDGSTDKSWELISKFSKDDFNVKGIKFRRNYGKSAALNVGFEVSEGDVVITMDADMQDSPDEIPELYKMIKEGGYDIVSGWKRRRYDPISKTIPSRFFNWVTRMVSGIKLHDFNCGLKAYKRDVVKSIEVYGEMHRYIPVIAKWEGFVKITEKEVQHRERKYGKTKFGIERFINGFLDLLSIVFVTKFSKKPMHFFGTIGTVFFVTGGVISVSIIIEKLYQLANNTLRRDVTQQPLFYIALVTMVIGMQLFLTGFIAEMISRNSADRNKYIIVDRTNIEQTNKQ